MRLLLVEDARLVREPLAHALGRAGWAVDPASDGERALELARIIPYDALVLDVMLPGHDGLTVLEELRRAGNEVPTILLTARGDVRDRVRGLDLGADDYLTKPFHIEELLARLRAVMRRHGAADPSQVINAFGLSYEPAGRSLTAAGKTLKLTPKEGLVLETLMRHAGHTAIRTSLERVVWGDESGSPGRLEAQVSLLRGRLAAIGAPVRIRAVRGSGYILEEAVNE